MASGSFIKKEEMEEGKIKTNLKIAEEDFYTAKLALENRRYNSAYKLHYDILHSLVEAFLCFSRIKSKNHQCLFAYICHQHPELELNWDFFEEIRTKRNGIQYYGSAVTYEDWKKVELQFMLYIKLFKKKIEEMLS